MTDYNDVCKHHSPKRLLFELICQAWQQEGSGPFLGVVTLPPETLLQLLLKPHCCHAVPVPFLYHSNILFCHSRLPQALRQFLYLVPCHALFLLASLDLFFCSQHRNTKDVMHTIHNQQM